MNEKLSKEITTITPQNLTDISFRDTKVITTDLLAMFYGTSSKCIRDNYNNNSGRFEAGKHFFKVSGVELRAFKNQTENIGLVQIPKKASHILIWTKPGTARHAKMLGTDKAWDVFDELEAHYFQPKSNMIQLDPSKNQPEILQLAADLSRQVKEKENLITAEVKKLNEGVCDLLELDSVAVTLRKIGKKKDETDNHPLG